MRLNIAPGLNEFSKLLFAKLELDRGTLASKQLVAQPDPIRVYDICLAIVRYFLNSIFGEISFDLATMNADGLP